ncbi:MAG: hypothetical protein ACI9MS_003179 [Glaciecola sp.]|jgi:uncharacterized protein (TIGR01244 family)
MSNTLVEPEAVKIIKITNHFSVSGELTESALDNLVGLGVDTLINVRPDNERKNQITDQDWRALASRHKLHYVYIPVKSCHYTEQDVKKFKAALEQSSNCVHGFCRTGTRATHLWALANKENLSFTEMQSLLKDKGYDLDMIDGMFDNVQ